MDARPTRSRLALSATAALLLTACPEDDQAADQPVDEPPSQEPAEEEPADDDPPGGESPSEEQVALDATCENEDVGYVVDYPSAWDTNEPDSLGACAAFDPEQAELPDEARDLPTDIAIVIREERVDFEELVDAEGDLGVRQLRSEPIEVDGRDAVAMEVEATGEGLYPEGTVSYRIHVDLGETTLVAQTFDVSGAQPAYEERVHILDEMMDGLTFTE